MSIELLWIIPVVAVALIILILLFNLQKESQCVQVNGTTIDLHQEVKEFNSGKKMEEQLQLAASESRLREIETTIQRVSTTLGNQQKIIENFKGKDIQLEKDLNELNQKLENLQHEYDTALSENCILKKRLKQLELDNHGIMNTPTLGISFDKELVEEELEDLKATRKIINIKQFDETRLINIEKYTTIDETSEIDISEMK